MKLWQTGTPPNMQGERILADQNLLTLGVPLLIVLGESCRWLCFRLFREPSILIAVLATFVEEVGYEVCWSTLLLVCLANFFVVKVVVRLVMDAVCFGLDSVLALWK